ncbi:hypothetical protein Tco_0653877 [Tanacetum coccineum]|uniref:Uncharacterized protein n=1 Tax=Tanacetum coccineum TaxID=301880 RepID=A0ABQ4X232_9ASTR
MIWSNIASGKNRLMKACLICSQVVITPGLSSLNHTLASRTRDDGKSLSLIASALVVPYQNILQILTNSGDVLVWISPRTSVKLSVFDHREVMTFNGEVISKVNHDDSDPGSGCYGLVVSPHRLNVDHWEW